MPTIDDVLFRARTRLQRVDVDDLAKELDSNTLVIDIRPIQQRREYGEIPGSIAIERNILEWRLDPASSARISATTDHDVRVVIVCQEGYASSLAAASLQDLGLHRATDLVGGVRAWREAGHPVSSPRDVD